MSKAIRIFREQQKPEWLRALVNLGPEDYLKVLTLLPARWGIPAVLFATPGISAHLLFGGRPTERPGNRRARDPRAGVGSRNCISRSQTASARQIRASTLYGNGYVADQIAGGLFRLVPYVQKRLHYVNQDSAVMASAI